MFPNFMSRGGKILFFLGPQMKIENFLQVIKLIDTSKVKKVAKTCCKVTQTGDPCSSEKFKKIKCLR